MGDNAIGSPFDLFAREFDEWFESSRGRWIFELETFCLQELIGKTKVEGRWLEVGVGTGRFAEALGIKEGIDPSRTVLEIADDRGIRTQRGYGEDLPYSDASFDGVLNVVTICFLADPGKALKESYRILKQEGCLIVGLVPADSPWGIRYSRKAGEGHRFYSKARFYTCEQVSGLATEAGLVFTDARSCLFGPPTKPLSDRSLREGVVTGAGFVVLKFVKGLGKTNEVTE